MNKGLTVRTHRLPSIMQGAVRWLVGALVFCLSVAAPAGAAGNGGSKGGPAKAAPSPDIVYMSSSSYAPSKPAIRGVALTISNDAVTSTDTQLAKALEGRDRGSIAWSPDGLRYAWIQGQDMQTRKIMWAAPGKAAAVLYQPADTDDAYVDGGSDGLAWGPACSGVGSTVVFARAAKWDPNSQTDEEPTAIMGIDIESAVAGSSLPPNHSQPRPIREASNPTAFALSPTGNHLAFNTGYGANETVSIVPMCVESPSPATLLSRDDIGAARYEYTCSDDPGSACPCGGDSEKVCLDYPYPAVHSIDWSGDAGRLALSVTAGPDPDYPWRDLRVAYLEWNEGNDQYQKIRVEQIALDPFFGSASSEHSPQWGPGATDNDCARLAFSQSAGASDGSTMNGRRLYLYDLVTTSTACFDGPREVSARDPRAIDWK